MASAMGLRRPDLPEKSRAWAVLFGGWGNPQRQRRMARRNWRLPFGGQYWPLAERL